MISLLIVDDDPYIRESLEMILGMQEGLEVAGVCANGYEALEFLQTRGAVDIVLMDIRMPECDGVMGTGLIKGAFPSIGVLILTTFDDDDYIVEAIKRGANGYLLKNTPPQIIIDAIRTVAKGHMLIDPKIARKLAGWLNHEPQSPDHKDARLERLGLTKAEQGIVRKVSEGLSNKEIAQTLYLSEGTVKNYISEILGKLSLRDRTQLAIYYLKL
ncbi:DNA-binding response regulator [Paenibacillus oryzae]|jgi:DNA-binding NarL/FixJ family response regulator|uniref:DNA-binding response regulator n=1 Tax=Paenibacillus oryzae TaxID=1844972 RepID=A0A1A5YCC6_9BACL|nr:response regulator transcription factor [Paenibacillus oryzae]OBR63247.1 DNA-binding response regulator [Paenibacillus oryzae]